ncbi:MAG: hypothetical protein LBB59_08910 [Campylobacteraceae bacterium]|jgi:hypothetical protein|nr:hypothetical protein [Campylobacteraceae bacterium]
MKKITLSISTKSFDITLEDDEFVKFFEDELTRFFKNKNSLMIGDILTAFAQECYDRFKSEKTMNELLNKIDKIETKLF